MVKISELLNDYDRNTIKATHKLVFHGVDGYDVYNITAPFKVKGTTYIAGRVEKRDSELSEIVFFKQVDLVNYQVDETINRLNLQDPYITIINDELVIGGTEVFDHPDMPGELWYKAVKYRGFDLNNLTRFFEGPCGMKDIRIVELKDSRILVFTRPQGEIGGRGQIGWLIVDSLDEISKIDLLKAPLLNTFIPQEWGGANELHILNETEIGVLSHIAKFDDDGNRHYYATTFIFDIVTHVATDFRIIATRDDLTQGDAKRQDLWDVVFSGGMIHHNQLCHLYLGAGDCEAHYVEIENPFLGRYTNEFS